MSYMLRLVMLSGYQVTGVLPPCYKTKRKTGVRCNPIGLPRQARDEHRRDKLAGRSEHTLEPGFFRVR